MRKETFVIKDIPPGLLNAMLSNIMQSMEIKDPAEAVRRMNSREWVVTPSMRDWSIDGDIIRAYFSSVSMTGNEWFQSLRRRNVISKPAETLLKYMFPDAFGPSICEEMVILPGSLWVVEDRTSEKIRAYARERNLFELTPEDACIIRARMTQKQFQDMGLSFITVMHEPSNGEVLTAVENDSLITHSANSGWNEGFGFAFGVKKRS